LSVKQPYASQIARGQKRIEYRSWRTDYLPRGQAVCIVELVDCVWDEEEDCWAWRLRSAQPVKPFPVRGRLKLYDVEMPDQ